MQIVYVGCIFLMFVILLRLMFRKFLNFPEYPAKVFTKDSGLKNLMNEEVFWLIINEAKVHSGKNYRRQCYILSDYLDKLSAEEIVQYDRTFKFLMAQTYSFRLWEAAYALNGGCSDDTFDYFRSWLIGQGRDKFYWTLKNPRLLFLTGVKDAIENYEGLAYCAAEAYEKKTGQSLQNYDDIRYPDAGVMFNEIKSFLKYPELALLAW